MRYTSEVRHPTPLTMARALSPLYYIEVNGLAASKDQSGAACQRQAARGVEQRPDAVVYIVQVDPNTGREVGRLLFHKP